MGKVESSGRQHETCCFISASELNLSDFLPYVIDNLSDGSMDMTSSQVVPGQCNKVKTTRSSTTDLCYGTNKFGPVCFCVVLSELLLT